MPELTGAWHFLYNTKMFIVYQPLEDEADYRKCKFFKLTKENKIILPKSNRANPLLWATKCRAKGKNNKVYILIPGRRFDFWGTRWGRGGGWYDKFLANLPSNWIRIGVTTSNRLNRVKLKRKTWDEPVDWIICETTCSWKIFRTGARDP